MIPYEIIAKKRDGLALSKAEIDYIIQAYKTDSLPDYQMAALCMAIYFQGMDFEETTHLTQAMLHSGAILDLSKLPGKKIDKHSTGGVGDKVSLPLVGIVPACGITVPMVSGRGLGHTGGTLDKLESIPGFNVNLSVSEFMNSLEKLGCCMIGQTKEVAPVDKKIYALRDVTATVSSIPLITASIMSKKLAEGADGYVLDIKYGSGALIQNQQEAITLGNYLVKTALLSHVKAVGYLTNMDQPLGLKIGNWLEVEESIEVLEGKGPKDLVDLTLLQAGTMIYLGEKAASIEEGIKQAKAVIANGKALDKFLEMTAHQGGDADILVARHRYPKAKHQIELKAPHAGYIHHIDALTCGLVNVMIGSGRRQVSDTINPRVGMVLHHKIGDKVHAGDTLLTLHVDDSQLLDEASTRLLSGIQIKDAFCDAAPLVSGKFTEQGFDAGFCV